MADEHRFGLISVVRRCWSLRGVRPYAPYHTKYHWRLPVLGFGSRRRARQSGALCQQREPGNQRQVPGATGASDPVSQHVVIWDRAGFHPRMGHATIPAGVHVLSLPAYSPELNPVEKIGSFIKDAVCNRVYQTLAEIEAAIAKELQPPWTQAQRMAQLIGEGWLPVK